MTGGVVVVPPPEPPPQLTMRETTQRRTRPKSESARRLRHGRTSIKQTARADAAPVQIPLPGPGGGVSFAVVLGRVAVTVSVAVLVPLSAADAGLMVQENRLEEGVQVRATDALNPLIEVRLTSALPKAPDCTVSCGICGTMEKSPIRVCIAVTFNTLLVEP